MDAGPRIESYDWAGGREAMLRFGPDDGAQVVVAPPLFEEANRTRALIAATIRRLAALGIGGVLPDLPGQSESALPTVRARLRDWRAAFAAAAEAAGARRHAVAVRGGALVSTDADVAGRYALSPVTGRRLVRDLMLAQRAAAIAAGERPRGDDPAAEGPPLLPAGTLLDRDLLRALTAAGPDHADRVVRLFPDGGLADRHLAPAGPSPGSGDPPRFRAPWAAAEPSVDPHLAASLADDIAAWIGRCDA